MIQEDLHAYVWDHCLNGSYSDYIMFCAATKGVYTSDVNPWQHSNDYMHTSTQHFLVLLHRLGVRPPL